MNRKMGKEYEQIVHKENKNGKNLLENHLTSLVLRKVQITTMWYYYYLSDWQQVESLIKLRSDRDKNKLILLMKKCIGTI